jgi:hypothetical protein
MNVSLELPDDLGREARHRALDASKSLSAWITDLVVREVRPGQERAHAPLLEALGDESLAEGELPLPDRRQQPPWPADFP